MGRRNVVDGLVATLAGAAGFGRTTAGTVVAYDHRCLNLGLDRAVVVLNNRAEQRRLTTGNNAVDYFLDAELYVRHNNDVVQARKDSDTYVDNIVAHVNANETLGGSAFDAIVEAVRVEDEQLIIGNKPFLLEVLTIRATEHLSA